MTPRSEASSGIIARNMDFEEFRQCKWIRLAEAQVIQLGGGISIHRAVTAGGVPVAKTPGYVVVCGRSAGGENCYHSAA